MPMVEKRTEETVSIEVGGGRIEVYVRCDNVDDETKERAKSLVESFCNELQK